MGIVERCIVLVALTANFVVLAGPFDPFDLVWTIDGEECFRDNDVVSLAANCDDTGTPCQAAPQGFSGVPMDGSVPLVLSPTCSSTLEAPEAGPRYVGIGTGGGPCTCEMWLVAISASFYEVRQLEGDEGSSTGPSSDVTWFLLGFSGGSVCTVIVGLVARDLTRRKSFQSRIGREVKTEEYEDEKIVRQKTNTLPESFIDM